jgi:hypothetical protein
MLQAPLAMYSSGLAGAGRRGLTAEARRKKRGKPEGAGPRGKKDSQQGAAGARGPARSLVQQGRLAVPLGALHGGAPCVAAAHRGTRRPAPPRPPLPRPYVRPCPVGAQACPPNTSRPMRTSWRRWRWRCSTSWCAAEGARKGRGDGSLRRPRLQGKRVLQARRALSHHMAWAPAAGGRCGPAGRPAAWPRNRGAATRDSPCARAATSLHPPPPPPGQWGAVR